MKKSKKTFLVTFVSSTDFLRWENKIEADSIEEVYDIMSKKGKILSIAKIKDN